MILCVAEKMQTERKGEELFNAAWGCKTWPHGQPTWRTTGRAAAPPGEGARPLKWVPQTAPS